MKRHKSFDAYFKTQNHKVTPKIKLLMMDAWTNARYGYIDTQPDELVGQRGNQRFVRINTKRINLDNVIMYEPNVVRERDPGSIIMYYLDGEYETIKCADSNERVRILTKLDDLLHCKKNLASHLPKDN